MRTHAGHSDGAGDSGRDATGPSQARPNPATSALTWRHATLNQGGVRHTCFASAAEGGA